MSKQDEQNEKREPRSGAAEAISRSEELLVRATLDSLSSHIVLVDESGEILIANQAWKDFAEANGGDKPRVLEGANYFRVCDSATGSGSEDAALFAEGIRSVLSGWQNAFGIEYPCHSPTKRRWFIGRVTRFSRNGTKRLVIAHENITERRVLEEDLQHRALHDPLTDLPNRTLFLDRLKCALCRMTQREGEVGVLFLDLNEFKIVNDSLGHEAGDELLVATARRLRSCLRTKDTLARFGGDEFSILLDNPTSLHDAVQVADRIVERLREPFLVGGQEVYIDASIGICMGTSHQNKPEDILRNADTAMYKAKVQGRTRYKVFEEAMHVQAQERLRLASDITQAIEHKQFVVFYQPIVHLENGSIAGVEALLRWKHPKGGLLAPSEFVPLAEETGLIVPLGKWVLEEACHQLKWWQAELQSSPPLTMAVNLSPRQFQQSDMVRTVEETLVQSELEAHCLNLEMTETVLIEATEGNNSTLNDLRRRGVMISIDDFGTGYSSLSYLKRIPANTMKIDQSFIKGLGEDVETYKLVQTLIDLAHTFGMHATAEGVESAEQASILREMGCDMGQGSYFSMPLSSEAVSKVLAKGSLPYTGLES